MCISCHLHLHILRHTESQEKLSNIGNCIDFHWMEFGDIYACMRWMPFTLPFFRSWTFIKTKQNKAPEWSLLSVRFPACPRELMKIREPHNSGTSSSRADTLDRAIDCRSRRACGWLPRRGRQPMIEWSFASRSPFGAFSKAKSGLIIKSSSSDERKRICCFDCVWWPNASRSDIMSVVILILSRRNTGLYLSTHYLLIAWEEMKRGRSAISWNEKKFSPEDFPLKIFMDYRTRCGHSFHVIFSYKSHGKIAFSVYLRFRRENKDLEKKCIM